MHFGKVSKTNLDSKIQYDYCDAYLDMYRADPKSAAEKAAVWADHPVPRWANRFKQILAQVDEINGASATTVDPKDNAEVQTELAALIDHNCFQFKPKGYKPSKEYQYAPLRLVFELKQDLRRKARLVIQGFTIDPRDLETRSTVVKGISVRLLDVITHRDNLKILTGDVGNAFI